jgi:hypothetical protein
LKAPETGAIPMPSIQVPWKRPQNLRKSPNGYHFISYIPWLSYKYIYKYIYICIYLYLLYYVIIYIWLYMYKWLCNILYMYHHVACMSLCINRDDI